jgi:hypothetical protein
MAEATQAYHPKVIHAIDAIARYYAHQQVKEQIRAPGQRVTDYAPKDISIMANALLEERWEEFIAKAKASSVVEEVRRSANGGSGARPRR